MTPLTHWLVVAVTIGFFTAANSIAEEQYIKPMNPYAADSTTPNAGGVLIPAPFYGFSGGYGGAYGGGAQLNPTAMSATGGAFGLPSGFIGSADSQMPAASFRPPGVESCVYSDIIRGLNSHTRDQVQHPLQPGSSFTGPFSYQANESFFSDLKRKRAAELSAREQASTAEIEQKIVPIAGKISALEQEKYQLSADYANTTPVREARIVEIEAELVQLGIERSALEDKAELNSYFFRREQTVLLNEDDLVHPLIRSIYRNKNQIIEEKSLTPIAQDLVSYVGFAVGGPAGLLIGSTVGTLLGGSIDKLIASVKEALSKPEVKIEEIVPLLQEICRWREFNKNVTNSLVDQNLKKIRSKARNEIFTKIGAAESEIRACRASTGILSDEIESLSQTSEIILNRIRQGKAKSTDDISVFSDLSYPPEVVRRLKSVENTSLAALMRELAREKLSRVQIAEAYNADRTRLNLGFLHELRAVVEKSVGNFSEEDNIKIGMILSASNNRLRTSELQLQRKLLNMLVTEKESTASELRNTYKEGSMALAASLTNMELAYVRSMNDLHRRAIHLQEEAEKDQPALYQALSDEMAQFEKNIEASPLKQSGERPDLSDIKTISMSHAVSSSDGAGSGGNGGGNGGGVCSAAELAKGCSAMHLFIKFCQCPAEPSDNDN